MRKGSRGRRKGRTKRRDPSRGIESELDLRLLGIKTFETSTGQQDRLQLNHSSSRILFRSFSWGTNVSFPSFPLHFACVCVCVSSSSLRFPHPTLFERLSSPTVCSVHPDPSGSTIPTPGPSRGSSSPSPPFAPPLSRPDLGASRLHVACPNDVSERTGTTAI